MTLARPSAQLCSGASVLSRVAHRATRRSGGTIHRLQANSSCKANIPTADTQARRRVRIRRLEKERLTHGGVTADCKTPSYTVNSDWLFRSGSWEMPRRGRRSSPSWPRDWRCSAVGAGGERYTDNAHRAAAGRHLERAAVAKAPAVSIRRAREAGHDRGAGFGEKDPVARTTRGPGRTGAWN
jgi:hypothetical protein